MKKLVSSIIGLLSLVSVNSAQAQNRVVDLISGNGIADALVEGRAIIIFPSPSPSSPGQCIYNGTTHSGTNGDFTLSCAISSDIRCPPFSYPCQPTSFTKENYHFSVGAFRLNGSQVYIGTNLPSPVTVTAANYSAAQIAPEMILSMF